MQHLSGYEAMYKWCIISDPPKASPGTGPVSAAVLKFDPSRPHAEKYLLRLHSSGDTVWKDLDYLQTQKRLEWQDVSITPCLDPQANLYGEEPVGKFCEYRLDEADPHWVQAEILEFDPTRMEAQKYKSHSLDTTSKEEWIDITWLLTQERFRWLPPHSEPSHHSGESALLNPCSISFDNPVTDQPDKCLGRIVAFDPKKSEPEKHEVKYNEKTDKGPFWVDVDYLQATGELLWETPPSETDSLSTSSK